MNTDSILGKAKDAINSRYSKLFIKLSATSLALYIVSNSIDFREIFSRIQEANWIYILASLTIMFFTKFIAIARINEFYKASDINLSFKINFKLFFIGLFYNMILPGGFGGDGYKVIWLKSNGYSTKIKQALLATLYDRINGMSGLSILTVVFIAMSSLMQLEWVSLGVMIFPFALLAFILGLWFIKRDQAILHLKILPYSLLIQGLSIIAICLNAMSVSNIDWWEYLTAFSLSTFTFLVPLFIGGIGSRELFLSLISDMMSFSISVALTAILLNHLQRLVLAFIGLPYIIKQKKII